MDIQNNKNCQLKKYDEIRDLNKPLNDEEINELKQFFREEYINILISVYPRKIYNLFINNVIFEPNENDADYINDLYHLGLYYHRIKMNYDLAKKYYLIAADKGNPRAMNELAHYYEDIENNYDLMIKYYLMATEKGHRISMYNLGWYYENTEHNYDLMKKYYLMAVDKGLLYAMNNLGLYYERIGNCNLMKKYYLMAIEKGSDLGMVKMEYYYNNNLPNNEDLQNYFNYSIRGNITIERYYIFCDNYKNIEKNRIIDLFCLEINNDNLKIKNFKFCLFRIINYINYRKLYKLWEFCELKNIKHFARYINKLLYCIKNKQKYKKCASELFKNKTSQMFMEYLDLYYYEHLKKIFAPGGKGYTKTKKHFELIAKQQ